MLESCASDYIGFGAAVPRPACSHAYALRALVSKTGARLATGAGGLTLPFDAGPRALEH